MSHAADLGPLPTLRVIGIDPGANTGLVCVDVPAVRWGADARPVWASDEAARYVAHATVRASAAMKLTDAERRATLGTRIRATLAGWVSAHAPGPVCIALEEPADISDGAGWSATRGTMGQTAQRGTAFYLGAHYALALAAAASVLGEPGQGTGGILAYPVNNYHGRPGWMQGGASRPQARGMVLARLRLYARHVGAPVGVTDDALGEDILCALGVARFHVAELHTQQCAAIGQRAAAAPAVTRGPRAVA